jgi:hypothetical protein
LIEFDVELNSIPIDDEQSKDITATWKMYNGFNPVKTFWTDSNALEMQKREILDLPAGSPLVDGKPTVNYMTIARNFMPVTSAISMRDQNQTNLQVTIMNDRSQAGAADLTDQASIEIMQHRRTLDDDERGVG